MPRIQLGIALILLLGVTKAHEHHQVTEIDPKEPLDWIIWVHMTLQTFVWGISFPIGMVLGLSKSKYHVPLQSINTVLTLFGAWLGHHHHGREFPATVHGTMAKILTLFLVIQVGCGVFLKLHIMEHSIRRFVKPVHGVIGKAFPVLEMLFGAATALGFCRDGNLGQCAAHYIMGSAFIGYAAILVIMLNVGGEWLKKRGCSQELLDSSVIMVWGIINTFTEHHGGPWTHKDMQHTMMGVLWWAGGMLGIFLSRKGQRSFVPAVIIIMTGWGMSAHEQALMISSKIHGLFGYALIAAGALRIVEVCFVLNDQPTPGGFIRVFQHLPPYLLVLGGTLFMSATDEEMHNADNLGIDHVSYALFDFSLSFLIYLLITFLVHLYQHTGQNAHKQHQDTVETGYSKVNQDGPEAYELQQHSLEHDREVDRDNDFGSGSTLRSGSDDATKIGGEDEIDWMDRRDRSGVRL